MTNKEILAELKKSYEYIQDISDNGCGDIFNGQLNSEIRNNLFLIMEKLADIYKNVREDISDSECEITLAGNCCSGYEGTYYIGDYITEDYKKLYNNDNNYTYWVTCEDLGYYWYEDYNFLKK